MVGVKRPDVIPRLLFCLVWTWSCGAEFLFYGGREVLLRFRWEWLEQQVESHVQKGG